MDYKSGQWKSKRLSILRRDRFRCRECQRYGIAVDASVVHHAYPAEDYPEYAWSDWNLVSLCSGCHNAMHGRETGALTERGLALMRRVSPPSLREFLRTPGRPGARNSSDGEENGGGGI